MPLMPLRDADPPRIGKYRLMARLGAGGMGVVYLGNSKDGPRTIGSQVAIKVLRPELSDDADFRARFRREVTALSRVRGICTVAVIEADTEAAQPYLVTEYAAGPTLAEWAGEQGPFGSEMLPGLASGLAEALVAIHAAGVVHRDLKPGNVLLTADGPKVIDFGIAQTLDASSVTRTGMSIGSPGFMAPEQVRGKSGPAADIFAWGLTVAYAASGRPPFGIGPGDAIFYRILHEEPDISAVPEALRPLVTAALAKKPEDRPTAQDLLSALAAGAPGTTSPSAGLQAMLARTWVMPAGKYREAAVARRPRRRGPATRRYPFLLPLAGAFGAIACAGVAMALSSSGQSALPAATAAPSATAAPCIVPPGWSVCGTAPPYTSATPLAVSPIAATPFGLCQADCPSLVQPPTSQASGSLTDDNMWLEQIGYQPVWNDHVWDNLDALSVIIGRKYGSTQGGLRVFFFVSGTSMGSDVPDGSASVQAFRLGTDEIDLRYQLHGASASTADVRYQWVDGNQLVRMDPIPPARYRA